MDSPRRGSQPDARGNAPKIPGFVARPPKSIAGKPIEQFTPEDKVLFDAFVEELVDALCGEG